MKNKLSLYLQIGLIIFLAGCVSEKKAENNTVSVNTSLPYILSMVHHNPGEGDTESAYSNPEFVKARGFNGMVFKFHANCAITYDNFEEDIVPQGSEDRMWIEKQALSIDEKLKKADAVGMNAYAFTDIFVAPKAIWEKYGDKMGLQETEFDGYGGDVKNVRKPNIQYPIIQELLRAQVDGIFERFPSIDGLMIRFGETYLHDTPNHMGGKPVRQGDEGIKDHVTLLNLLREEVCVKQNKKLFYRTWDFGWMHTEPEVYTAITDQIEPHPNLIFSIKHTKGDFHRTFPFNPTLGIGKHPQVVEVQSQREYEGKGAHPNYVAKAVIHGFEEYEGMDGFKGLQDLRNSPNFSGVAIWPRGGGWKGPYINNELWCDLNAYVVNQWALDTTANEADIFTTYCETLNLTPKDTEAFREIALLSNKGVFLGRTSKVARINPWWIRDQFMGGTTSDDFNNQTSEAWGRLNSDFEKIVENDLVTAVLAEKQTAVEYWKTIERLADSISSGSQAFKEHLKVSCTYGRIKYEIIQQAWIVMLKGMEGKLNNEYDVANINEAKAKYDALWVEFKELKANNPQCASLYVPYSFTLENEDFQGEEGMEKAVNHFTKLANSQ